MKKLLLWLSLIWSVLMVLFGVAVVGSGVDLENIALRHDLRELVAAAPDAAAKIGFYDTQWLLLNRTAVCLVVTGLFLFIVSVIALRSSSASQRIAS